jgi:hypothetical protein
MRRRSLSSTAAQPRRFWPASKDRLITGPELVQAQRTRVAVRPATPAVRHPGHAPAESVAFVAKAAAFSQQLGRAGAALLPRMGAPAAARPFPWRAASNPAYLNYSNCHIATWPRKGAITRLISYFMV